MKANIMNIVLVGLIVLFAWLWITKQSEPIHIPIPDKTLVKELKISNAKLMRSDTIIDSLTIEIVKITRARLQAVSALKSLVYAYEKQIEDIVSNPIATDVELFRTEFARSKNN